MRMEPRETARSINELIVSLEGDKWEDEEVKLLKKAKPAELLQQHFTNPSAYYESYVGPSLQTNDKGA